MLRERRGRDSSQGGRLPPWMPGNRAGANAATARRPSRAHIAGGDTAFALPCGKRRGRRLQPRSLRCRRLFRRAGSGGKRDEGGGTDAAEVSRPRGKPQGRRGRAAKRQGGAEAREAAGVGLLRWFETAEQGTEANLKAESRGVDVVVVALLAHPRAARPSILQAGGPPRCRPLSFLLGRSALWRLAVTPRLSRADAQRLFPPSTSRSFSSLNTFSPTTFFFRFWRARTALDVRNLPGRCRHHKVLRDAHALVFGHLEAPGL